MDGIGGPRAGSLRPAQVLGTTGQVTVTDNGDGTITISLSTSLDPLIYKGAIDCSSNPNYPAADAGHVYIVSVGGKIGGASGAVVTAGDLAVCKVDGTAAGTQAAVGANWDIVQTNIDLTNISITGGTITGTTVSGITLASGANTFSLTVGTASLDIAAGATLDVNANLTVEAASAVNQDLTSDAGPTHAHMHLTDTIAANDSSNQAATTTFAKSEDAVIVNPKSPAQALSLTASASVSGPSVPHSAVYQNTTNSCSYAMTRELPTWTPAANVILYQKLTGGAGIQIEVVATTGVIRTTLNATVYNSAVPGGGAASNLAANTRHQVRVVINVGATTTTVSTYIDGVLVNTTAAQANVDLTNTAVMYLDGTSSTRYALIDQETEVDNFAPTAAEVLQAYQYGGPLESWKWGSQTALTSGTLTVGNQYIIDTYVSDDDFTNVGGTNVAGTRFTAIGTTPTHWAHSSSLRKVGATLYLPPEGIQNDKWYDASTNQLNASYPASGSSLARPELLRSSAKIASTSFAGTVSVSGTTATFSSAADCALCKVGSTIIAGGATRYVCKLTNATTLIIDSTVSWTNQAITSIQDPQYISDSAGTSRTFVAANGSVTTVTTASGAILFHRTVDGKEGIGTTTPGAKLVVNSANGGSTAIFNGDGVNPGLLMQRSGSNRAQLYTDDGLDIFSIAVGSGLNDALTIKQSNGNVGIGTMGPIYTEDVNGPINSRVYYWCDDFDDEAAGVQFESGLNADFWATAGTNYAAANVTYTGGTGGTLKALCANADNDSVTILGLSNVNVSQNPILEARIKIDTKETAAFYVGFASAAFADVNGAFCNDCFLVGINSDNGHTFGATQIVAASVDNGAAVDYDDMGVAIVSDTYVKIKIDLTDTEQPRVWINDTEVGAGSISGTVQNAIALAPYIMVQNLAGGAIQRFVTVDYIKVWSDRG